MKFHSFPDIEANVKNQIDKIKSTQFLPKDIPVYGFVYNVRTGKLKQVVEVKDYSRVLIEQMATLSLIIIIDGPDLISLIDGSKRLG